MEQLVEKIKKIQNKQRSLMWGSDYFSDTEVIFAVGSKAYPRQPHYFSITAENTICLIDDDNKRTIIKQCETSTDVVSCIIELLKKWYPAKG